MTFQSPLPDSKDVIDIMERVAAREIVPRLAQGHCPEAHGHCV